MTKDLLQPIRSVADAKAMFAIRKSQLGLYGFSFGYYPTRMVILGALDYIKGATYQATHRRNKTSR